MKNKFTLGLIIIGITIAIVAYFMLKPRESKKIIAVITTLSHPALDMARAGFVQEIKAQLGLEYEIKDFNAEGSMQSANLIARQVAHDSNIKGIFTIGSLATQTLAKAEKNRPIVFAAVSDPEAIMPDGSSNVCGLSDAIDAEYQIATILDMLPETKSIALLYSPHETNSASVVKKLQARILNAQIKSELVGVYEPQQIASASLRACQNSDVVLIPLDNQLAASMPAVIKASKHENCIMILTDKALMHHGAALAFGVDYEKSGQEAAVLMTKILLKQQSPATIGTVNPKDIGVYMNKSVIQEKAIKINPDAKTNIINQEAF